MQFVANGPDIPDALLQAQEEGRVVFFCGAGISYPAGLPGFKGLAEEIYRLIGTSPTDIEQQALTQGQFDAVLDLLERRLPGQRRDVRLALAKALRPKLRRKGAIDTHAALLTLGRSRKDALRIVTTNFDRVFHAAAKRLRQPFDEHAAPMLPVPKNSRWNGLVYLHGLIPERPDEASLNRLVVTSGDFGLAYLTERWAARFVSELFRNYVVCFVGYSINDPVLRYMMDALAADRRLGEVTPQAWALGDYQSGHEHAKTVEWEAKGVTPILYEQRAGVGDHSALHRTLQAWADTYRDGVTGKERIVVSHALARPSASTKQDDFVGRVLWALSDDSGLPAKRFAELKPVPPLEWLLDAFAEDRYAQRDLRRFGVPPRDEIDTKLRFCMVRRPAPYHLAPPMALVSGGVAAIEWDAVMHQLAIWLLRHLNDPRLLLWIAQHGGSVHWRLEWYIHDELERLVTLEREGKTKELLDIQAHAPNAVPEPVMRTLWRLLLSGRVKSTWQPPNLYRWKTRFAHEGLTATLRVQLRELLAPRVRLRQPFRSIDEPASANISTRLRQLVDWELALASDHVRAALADRSGSAWEAALPEMLDEYQLLLRDALDLMRELGVADERDDRSHWDLPSISPHWQNRGFREWVVLIELLRDAWMAMRRVDAARATRIAFEWFALPYPTFKRLAFFAASQDDAIAPEAWIEWLLVDDAWWLWTSETHREVCRLFVTQGRNVAPPDRERLELAILRGPPRFMYRDNLELTSWENIVDREVWLRLSKLRASGLALGAAASAQLGQLSQSHPSWTVDSAERDEFLHWMSGTGDPDFEQDRVIEVAPRERVALTGWLLQPPPSLTSLQEDNWREVCRAHFYRSWRALCDLAHEGHWPTHRWREALQAWSEEGRSARSWRWAASLVQRMPEDVVIELVDSVSWWLEAASKSVDCHESVLVDLSRRILDVPLEERSGITQNGEPIRQPVTEAINHAVGHVTSALLNLWFKREPSDNDGIPPDLEPLFTRLSDVRVARYRHGRVLLASRLIALFRVDREWTKKNVLPHFDWSSPVGEADAVWQGFLWSPRLYRPLLIALKREILQTARHYSELGEFARQFSGFLTYAALGPTDGFSGSEFREAFASLPLEALYESARALTQALAGAGEQKREYWHNRVLPFWREVWPQSRDLISPEISESLADLSIVADADFPGALSTVQAWLRPIEHPHYIVNRLHESQLCSQFPADALKLLDSLIDNRSYPPLDLRACLDEIERVLPSAANDTGFRRLRQYSRTRGY